MERSKSILKRLYKKLQEDLKREKLLEELAKDNKDEHIEHTAIIKQLTILQTMKYVKAEAEYIAKEEDIKKRRINENDYNI